MSLVGPRPVTGWELQQHYGPAAEEVLTVKPGLTGLWQVQGRGYLSMRERVALDLEFVRSTSKWLRLRITLRTVQAVILGSGAW
jgi:lipopolysaccharide/colanic/teichoic acid biosynthesis glycosyltransferase